MSRKKKSNSSKPGVPDYMVTYSDLVTLLMCFFVLLFSMSTVEVAKFEQVASAMSGKNISLFEGGANDSIIDFGGTGIMDMPAIELMSNESSQENDGSGGNNGEASEPEQRDDINSMASDFKTYFAENNMSNVVEVLEGRESFRIRFTDGVLFDSGRADLKPEYTGLLDIIAEELLSHQYVGLRIEGHTDNVPMMNAQFPSNEHLSAGRAISVAWYFIREKNFEPAKIEFVGYGEYRPIADNDTTENRAKNRRVEIVFIPYSISDTQ